MVQVKEQELQLDVMELRKVTLVLRAINHKLRQQMILLIYKQKEITVTEIYTKLGLEQSIASQHLSILRRTGFVNAIRNGKQILYSVNEPFLEKVHKETYQLLHQY